LRASPSGPRPNYGIDRPDLIYSLVAIGVIFLVLGAFSMAVTEALGFALAAVFLVFAALLVLSSNVLKVREAERLLDSIPWRGDETVLDVGCGRGLMLVTAAKHLTTGRAIGVDIWKRWLQSSNRPDAALENARRAGVAEKVDVRSADARQLPFDSETFDVLLSSLVLHHISRPERRVALTEMVRVVKPGGRIALIEGFRSGEFTRILTDLGVSDLEVSAPKLSLFGTGTLKAVKPRR